MYFESSTATPNSLLIPAPSEIGHNKVFGVNSRGSTALEKLSLFSEFSVKRVLQDNEHFVIRDKTSRVPSNAS